MSAVDTTMRNGARAAVPVAVATALVGVSFGVLARPVMGAGPAIAMSAIVFAGAAQFAALAVLASGGGAPAAIVAGVLLNLRFLPMGVALAPSLTHRPLGRALRAQALVDASWALAHRGEGRFDVPFLLGATAPQYAAWLLGTVAGVLVGGVLGDPSRLGLDAVYPAFFLALLAAEIRGRRGRATAALGAAITFALTPVAPPGVPIIAAAAAAALGLAR